MSPNDAKPVGGGARRNRLETWMVAVGGAALLVATAADSADVIARHVGWRFLGAIEITRAAILVGASCAMVVATIAHKHATVRLVLDRLPATALRVLRPVHAMLAGAYFLALAAGCAWIALDLMHGHEESEILHIPYMPLRLVGIGALLATGALFLRRGPRTGPDA